MSGLKEQLQKKTLPELEALIFDHNQKIESERDLITLGKLNSELAIMREVHGQKLRESGKTIRKGAQPAPKADLKSFDDYLKSKKK